MSNIPRYKPVPNHMFGIADDAYGKLCEYRYYEQQQSIIQSLSANVLRLGNEVRDLTKERDALKEHIRYLEIELTTETARWERAMQEVERLRKAGDMCDQLLACFEMEGRRGVNIGRDMWNAAKDGKPTE